MARRRNIEDAEHRIVADYLDRCGVLWCHVPNGGARNPIVGAQLRRLGVKRGVPDALVFDVPPRVPEARGVAVELKAPKGRPTDSQQYWVGALNDRGWHAFIAWGAAEAIEQLAALGYTPGSDGGQRRCARSSTSAGIGGA